MATPQMPPAGPSRTSPLVWILVGIVGFIFLIGITLAVGGYFVAHKVRQMAHSPASVVRTLAALNPDVEVISTDENSGKVTIKDKKTGKVVTMNFDDIKGGKISIQEDGKEAVTIQANGGKEGQGSVDIKTADGNAHFGAGSSKTPAWVPAYPGSSPQGTYSAQTDKEESGTFTFKTKDSVDQVSKYYQDALKNAGYKLETMVTGSAGAMVSAKNDDAKRTVVVTLGADNGETSVAIMFNEKK